MGATSLMVASALSQAGSTFSQINASKAQADYQQQVFNANARLANLQAEDATKRGNKSANDHNRKVRQLIGSQRAKMAAQGLDLNSGSALEIQEDTAALGAEDAQTIRNNAFREAWGYKVQASEFENQGQFVQIAAKNQANNTLLSGGLSLVRDLGYSQIYSSGTKKV